MLPYHLKPCYTVKLFTAMPLAWRGHLGLPQLSKNRAPVTPSNLGHSRSCTNSARQVKTGAANRWLVFAGYGSVSYLKDRQHSDPFVDPTTGSEIGLLVFRVCFQEQRRNPARSTTDSSVERIAPEKQQSHVRPAGPTNVGNWWFFEAGRSSQQPYRPSRGVASKSCSLRACTNVNAMGFSDAASAISGELEVSFNIRAKKTIKKSSSTMKFGSLVGYQARRAYK